MRDDAQGPAATRSGRGAEPGSPGHRNRYRSWFALALITCCGVLLLVMFMRGQGAWSLRLLTLGGVLVGVMLIAPRFASTGLILVSSLFFLAFAEFLLPRLLANPADSLKTSYPSNYWGRGDVGTQANEGRFHVVKSGPQGGPVYDVVYTIGSDHFRVTPGDRGGPGRVNFLGCSMTFGEGLQDNETLAYYFGQRGGESVAVKNFGFHGYGPQQALAILQGARDTTGRVNVFLTAPWHALRSACKPVWTAGSPRYELVGGREVRRNGECGDVAGVIPASVSRSLSQSSLYRVVRDVVWDEVSDADIELYVAMVREMANLSHARGQRFAVGFVKADETFFRHTQYSNQKLLDMLALWADEVIDLTLADRYEAVERRHYLHEMDRHPSAEANRERATLLAERLGPWLSPAAKNAP